MTAVSETETSSSEGGAYTVREVAELNNNPHGFTDDCLIDGLSSAGAGLIELVLGFGTCIGGTPVASKRFYIRSQVYLLTPGGAGLLRQLPVHLGYVLG
jgi:hypothetical protein